METSRRSGQPRWFAFSNLFLLLFLLNLSCLLLLGVGLLVTVPLTYRTLTLAYADILGLKSAHNIYCVIRWRRQGKRPSLSLPNRFLPGSGSLRSLVSSPHLSYYAFCMLFAEHRA
jgi:hypothetical protein